MDHFAYSLTEGWKREGTLQYHTIHHLYLKEGFSCVVGIQNREAVLLYETNPDCLARFLPFFQPGYGFVWVAFFASTQWAMSVRTHSPWSAVRAWMFFSLCT
jgi:hypothetical protein